MEIMGDLRLALWDATEIDQVAGIVEEFVTKFEKWGYLESNKMDYDSVIGQVMKGLESALDENTPPA